MWFRFEMRKMNLVAWWDDKISARLAYALPRQVAYWAFIRVATEFCKANPGDQKVSEAQLRWIRNTEHMKRGGTPGV